MKYVLITAAWNEERHLPELIRTVAGQSQLPRQWVVVSDGSTDRTDALVREAAHEHQWITLVKREVSHRRSFAGKAGAFNQGYQALGDTDFDLIGNLDADVLLPPDYYEHLIEEFKRDPRLGVAGTPYYETEGRPDLHSCATRFADLTHVSGQTQMFRRECLRQLGGYIPMEHGSIDWLAVTMARMHGWNTRTSTERVFFHRRQMGTAQRSTLGALLQQGRKDYLVGSHPLWHSLRCVLQARRRPILLSGGALFIGYWLAFARREVSSVPPSVQHFHRSEQLRRLRQLLGLPPTGEKSVSAD